VDLFEVVSRTRDFCPTRQTTFRPLNFRARVADTFTEGIMTATAPLDVLIVDDSAAIRKILQRVLRQTDLNLGEINEAGDGTEAVEILKNRTFGLILSDINMPQMDGLQLLARIKEMDHLKNVPVIMITTEGGQGKVMEAVQLGATGYVRKPFTAEQIKEKLAGVII
jgi:two-component system chemotaxis response regulator CheY